MKKNVVLSMFFWLILFCAVASAQDSIPESVAPALETTAEPTAETMSVVQDTVATVVKEEPVFAGFEHDSEPEEEPISYAGSSEMSLKFGIRLGLGVSMFREHVHILTSSGNDSININLDPAFALSAGLTTQLSINGFFSIAPELQYSLYRSNKEKHVKDTIGTFDKEVYKVGVYMHALELPVLARFNFGSIYMELGPKLGLNLYSSIYSNEKYYRAKDNLMVFGSVFGVGLNSGGLLLGIRGYFGITEYAKDAKGIPMSIQLSMNTLIF